MGAVARARVRPTASVVALLALLVSCATPAPQRPAAVRPVETAASGPHAMVATAHADATEAGLELLRRGGNAVDAAVAAAFAIGVVEPHASGLGGEGVMIVHLAATRQTLVLDYKSVAPAADPDGDVARSGAASATVPGVVAGLCTALRDWGTMPLDEVLAPAIRLAEDGFDVSPGLAAAALDYFETIVGDEALAATFCPSGLPVEGGARIRIPELGQTLRSIAREGPSVFYTGAIADRIVAAMREGGGLITDADLAGYRPIVREPLRASYRGFDIFTTPPPTGGLAVLDNLNLLARLDLGAASPFDVTTVHLLTEVMRRGYADHRAWVGDPGFVEVPVAGLMSDAYAERRIADIRPDAISDQVVAGEPEVWESPSTTSLVAVDAQGNMVAVTQTLSDLFGAKVMVPGTGVILNNELRNFSARGPNLRQPGKRPRTSIAPTLVFLDDRPVLAVATPGAARIVSTTTLLLVNLIDHGMDLRRAIDAPRFHAHNTDPRLFVEGSLPLATVEGLADLGYPVEVLRERDPFFGGAQAIMVDLDTGALVGVADPRRDGTADGL